MGKSLVGRAMWVGRARVLVLVLAVMLATLAIGAAAASAATVGQLAAAWGKTDKGQFGNGTTGSKSTVPVGIGGGLNATNIQALAGGNHHSLALRNNSTVWAWGDNSRGQLGNGTTTTTGCECISTPVQVNGLSDVIAIAAGADHSLALRSNGTVWAWGFGGSGELGNGTFGDILCTCENVPVQVSNLSNVVAIDAGADHNLALKKDGTVWAWGANQTGQLGNGTTGGNSNVPVQVHDVGNVGFLQGVTAISGGGNHSLALKSDGTVMSWGENGFSGQLGNGTTGGNSNVPVQVSNLRGVKAISAGGDFSLAIKKTPKGTVVRSWGDNSYGQLGNGTIGGNCSCSSVPVAVSGLKGVKAISAGGDFSAADHSLALKTNGTVMSWGSNDSGQLGNGDDTFTNSFVPVKVINLSGVTAIAAGGYHSLAK